MRIVFMGTPDFAAVSLQRLLDERVDVVGVFTQPDKPKNRGMKLAMSDVKQYALTQDIPVLQPQSFRDPAVVEELRALAPDVIACVAYGKILPQSVLEIPPLGCINIHASVLPKLRGSGPVQWAILNGEEETGVTAMYMAPEMDAGDIIEIRRTSIDPAENQQQIAAFLVRHPEFTVVKPAVALPAGMTAGEHGALSVPTRTGMDGFFLCAMQKNG